MKKNLWIMIFQSPSFLVQKMYVKNDYTLYHENFQLPDNSKLRTDGVYVLLKIWTKDSERKADEHIFYKFYENGQSNLTIDLNNEIKTEQDYIESIRKHVASTKNLISKHILKAIIL